ncbi:MAG: hypothetical protein H6536_04230 [Bacteroidales bacterium]|nr:hypothetical protein [Bacteroidales bacterium]
MITFAKNVKLMESNSSINAKKEAFEQGLRVASDEVIVSTLVEIRDSGEEYMVEAIINLLFSKRTDRLKGEVMNFLVDIKSQSAVAVFVSAIRNNYGAEDLHRLVSVCWQSRLDFSADIELFIDLLCNADEQTSIEAFSVIENSLDGATSDRLSQITALLRKEQAHACGLNQSLVEQAILSVEGFGQDGSIDNINETL